jgi:hypothetical protein
MNRPMIRAAGAANRSSDKMEQVRGLWILDSKPQSQPNPIADAEKSFQINYLVMAERVGFEPTIRGYRIHTFQACAFDHSATAPRAMLAKAGV